MSEGLQLAAAVLVAYGASMALGLPESLWAVMSTLIVMRPVAGATLAAGRDRVGGTLSGALCGLGGVWLEQLGTPPLVTLLAIVATLAFASAAAPGLRSAPVAALIVLAAGGLAGHSALQAALLRVIQIGIGVGVAMGVALVSTRVRAAHRLDTACATLLQRLARQLETPRARPTEAEAERAGAATREALARLSVLAGGADIESRLFRRSAPSGVDARRHRRIAALTGRVVQDVAVLSRVLLTMDPGPADHPPHPAARTAAAALASVAAAIAGPAVPELEALRTLAEDHVRDDAEAVASSPSAALLAGPLHLLLDDLQAFCPGRG